jgi:hypothetical protein
VRRDGTLSGPCGTRKQASPPLNISRNPFRQKSYPNAWLSQPLSGTAVAYLASRRRLGDESAETIKERFLPSSTILRGLERVNKELLLILSMFVIALLLNHLFDSQRMLLSFYAWPTLASAYIYGRRHATLTAFASVLLVGLLTLNSGWLSAGKESALAATAWIDLAAFGGTLMITGYLMGTLHEHKSRGKITTAQVLALPALLLSMCSIRLSTPPRQGSA